MRAPWLVRAFHPHHFPYSEPSQYPGYLWYEIGGSYAGRAACYLLGRHNFTCRGQRGHWPDSRGRCLRRR